MNSYIKRLILMIALLPLLANSAIIGALPNTISDGQAIDAVPIMNNYNFIVAQTNANVPTYVTTALASAVISGGTVDNTPIGSITPSTGVFTTLNATSIGATTPSTGAFTSLSSSTSQLFGPSAGSIRQTNLSNSEISWQSPIGTPTEYIDISDSSGNNGGSYNFIMRGLTTAGTAGTNLSSVQFLTNNFYVGSGTNGWNISPQGSVNAAIYLSSVTPNSTNYSFEANSTSAVLNGASNIALQVVGTTIANVTSDTLTYRGTTAGGSASAGQVGEVLSATASSLSLSSASYVSQVSLTLTAGDWDIYGAIGGYLSASTNTEVTAAISTSSSSVSGATYTIGYATVLNTDPAGISVPVQNQSISSSTTYYLVAAISAGSVGGTGTARIWARRVR